MAMDPPQWQSYPEHKYVGLDPVRANTGFSELDGMQSREPRELPGEGIKHVLR